MANVLMVLGKGFTDDDLKLGKLLRWKGHEIKIACKTRLATATKEGQSVKPDIAFHEINPEYFDFIIISTDEPKEMITKDLTAIIRSIASKKKGAAGIGKGALVLAYAGILTGKKATVAKNEKSIKFIRDSGATYVPEGVVLDGNIVSAADPEAADEIVEKLAAAGIL